MRVYYFGSGEPFSHNGHHWYGPGMSLVEYKFRKAFLPEAHNIDGRFAPTAPQQYGRGQEFDQGLALLLHTKSHTIISFWDRTGDKRPASNSSFVVIGHHTFDEIIDAAKEQYPRLFKRFDFEIGLIRL